MLSTRAQSFATKAPRRHGRRWPTVVRWLVPLVSGACAGCLLGSAGYGAACVGIVVGFAVAALSAAFAPQRRLAFGLLGNGCTLVACFATINNWRGGSPIAFSDMPSFALLAGVVIIPGLLGIALVSAIDSATRPAA